MKKLKMYFILILEEYGGRTHNLDVFESIEEVNKSIKKNAGLYGVSKKAKFTEHTDVINSTNQSKLRIEYFVYVTKI